MLAVLAFTGASIWTLIRYRNENPVRCFTVLTCIYMISLLFIGSFDYILPLYCVFLVLTFGWNYHFRPVSLLFLACVGCYTIWGILFQDWYLTITTVITRYGYILIFILYCSMKKHIRCRESDVRFILYAGLLTELLMILCVWVRDGFGARVISNNQPLGGGIVIALIMLIGIGYKKQYFTTIETVIYSFCSIMIVILSGTRGYMVLLAFPLLVIFWMFLMDIPGKGRQVPVRVCIVMFAVYVFFLGMALFVDMTWITDLLRMNDGLGYRGNENLFVSLVKDSSPWYRTIFGYGFGGSAEHLDNYYEILEKASWNRSFMYSKLQESTIFHNYWNTIWYKQGYFGLVTVGIFYAGVFYDILKMETSIWNRWILMGTAAGTIISLTFRITATCSVFEFLILGYVMYGLRREKSE